MGPQDLGQRVGGTADVPLNAYTAVFEGSADAIQIVDMQGIVLAANPANESVYGYRPDELIGRSAAELLAVPGGEEARDEARRRLADGRAAPGEVRCVRKDGREIIVSVSRAPIRDAAGAVVAVSSISRDVTAWRDAEARLALSEARYRLLAHGATDLVVCLALDGTFAYVSPSVTAVLGWNPRDLLGEPAAAFVHPDEQGVFAAVLGTDAGTAARRVQIRMRAKDGRWVWCESASRPVVAPETGAVQVRCAIRDITLRVEAQEALGRSEELLGLTLDNAPIGMAMVALDGTWLRVNKALCEIVDRPEPDLLAHTFQDITHPDDLDKDLALLGQLVRGEIRRYRMDKRYIRPGGELVWVQLDVSLVRDEAGNPLHLLSQIQDITETRAARRRFEVTFDHAVIGMALLDTDGRMLQVNAALCEVTGYDEAELLGARLGELVEPDSRDDIGAVLADLETDRVDHLRVESPFVGADGTVVWMQLGIARAEGGPEHGTYLVMQAEDISERKRYEARLLHQTLHDPLTGLGNRLLLRDRLAQAFARRERHHGRIGLLFIDMDGFKAVNDRFGHEAGDELLRETANRVRASVRPEDTVVRLGGDEFVVLAEDLASPEAMDHIAARIHRAITAPWSVEDTTLSPTASIGVALAPDGPTTSDALLSQADAAMYRAKRASVRRQVP